MPALHSWDQGGARGGSPAQAEELVLLDNDRQQEMLTFLERIRMRVQSVVPEKRQLFASGIHFASENNEYEQDAKKAPKIPIVISKSNCIHPLQSINRAFLNKSNQTAPGNPTPPSQLCQSKRSRPSGCQRALDTGGKNFYC